MTINEQLDKVQDNVSLVHAAGVEAGRQAEWSDFWDIYQQNGQRTDYFGAFSGSGWKKELFRPKYDIKPTGARSMFYSNSWTGIDLANCGVKIDFSNCTNFYAAFQAAGNMDINITIDCSKTTELAGTFAYSGPKRIQHLILHEGITYNSTFASASQLKEIYIEGVIGNTISFSTCGSLNLESAKSILIALKDFSGTTDEFTRQIVFHANVWALLDADGATSPNGTTWKDYVTAKCWNK